MGFRMKNEYIRVEKDRCLEDIKDGTVDLCLVYCGLETCSPCHRYGPNNRRDYVMHIVSDGYGKLEMDNKVYHLKKGDLFIIPPRVNAYYEADEKEPWTYMWVGFSGIKCKEYMEHMGLGYNNPVMTVKNLKVMKHYIDKILEQTLISYVSELKRNAYLLLLFSEIVNERQACSEYNSKAHPGEIYVKNAINYIFSHYMENIKIEEISSVIGINRSYLSSSFKSIAGCSPKQFLLKVRLEKAQALLRETYLPISAISEKVGYTDHLAFSKMFKLNTGMSPRKYREKEKDLLMLLEDYRKPKDK